MISPVLIILIVIFALSMKSTGKNIQQNRMRWIIGGYGLVLLSSLFVLQVLPQESFLEEARVSDNALAQAVQASEAFYSSVLEGRPQDVEGVFVVEQWNFPYSGNQLTVTDTGGSSIYSNMMIVAERTEDLDNRIEVTHYVTRTIVEQKDLTNLIKLPSITMDGNKLMLAAPPQYEIELGRFQREFVVAQLFGDQQWMRSGYAAIGAQALYLRIPRDLDIDSQMMNNIIVIEKQ